MLIFPAALGAFEIRADVDRTEIGSGESITLTLSAEGGDPDMDLSAIRDFRVISRGTSSSMQIVNGAVSREKRFTYLLVPLKEGQLTIPPLKAEFEGKPCWTEQISITVADGSAGKTPDSVPPLSVDAVISKANPYEGEQIVYTFTLRSRAQYANARFQKPEFSGFTVKEIGQKDPYRKTIGGREFTLTELRYLLIPLKAGSITIEPALLECDVATGKRGGRTSSFDSLFPGAFFNPGNFQHRVFRTDPLSVEVKPLPADAMRPDFSGLVGTFTMKASLERDDVKVGESTTLTIILEGRGNIMDAAEPSLEVPDTFKSYTDIPQDNLIIGEKGVEGSRTFRFALVATREGEYRIEPVRVSYFDPEKKACRVLSSEPFSLSVQESPDGTGKAVTVAGSLPADEERHEAPKKVEFTGRDILPLKEELDALEVRRAMTPLRFLFLLGLPCVIYGAVRLLLSVRRRNQDVESRMIRRAREALNRAERPAVEAEEFFSCLRRALLSIVLSREGVQREMITYGETVSILVGSGCPPDRAKEAADLMKRIESARYGGAAVDETFRKELLDETARMVRGLTR